MTFVSKPPPDAREVSIAGITVQPFIYGRDGYAIFPDGREPKLPNRVVSVSLCPRRNRLSISFQAHGITYVGRPGTEDPLEAAEIGSALRDAVEARLLAIGFNEVWLSLLHFTDNRDATPTRRSDRRLMLSIATAMVRSAPHALAEATKVGLVRPAWSVRPAPMAIQRALR